MPEYGSVAHSRGVGIPLLSGIGGHEGEGQVEGGFEACFIKYTGHDPGRCLLV
jgi:hypothetical protein